MVALLTVLVILFVAAVYWREGVFSAFCMCVCVVLSGLIAVNFWEPLANLLEPPMSGSAFAGLEDFLCLAGLFGISLGLLRLLTNILAPRRFEYPPLLFHGGGAAFGALAGYLVSGFLVCALQTLPVHERFLGFEPHSESEWPLRTLLPPDRVWLAMMRHASYYPLARGQLPPAGNQDPDYPRTWRFDPEGTFEERYLRYRRYNDERGPLPFTGAPDTQSKE